MNIQDNVKSYYGKVLQSSADLQTDACCTVGDIEDYLKPILANIHPDVAAKYYGCGLIAPLALEGASILDLGSGAGQDVYALSQLAGPTGRVVGVDMTPEQLAVARAHKDWHAEKFGFSNVDFLEGDIERLADLDLELGSFDVIVSNCVINLVADKPSVFAAAHALLKPGGEFYFSDVYADRRLGDDLRNDPVAQGECLGGALYWNDFLSIAKTAGFADPRLVTDRPLGINNTVLRARLAPAALHSATYRLFKIDGLESSCEDYGQAVVYKGGVKHSENAFTLDAHHFMEKGRVFPVCGNTNRMLSETRFAPYFDFLGNGKTHYGVFPGCGAISPFGEDAPTSGACC
ncbi:MAG: methyltransferase domain-containing protein [Pseudomonadota bacterium]